MTALTTIENLILTQMNPDGSFPLLADVLKKNSCKAKYWVVWPGRITKYWGPWQGKLARRQEINSCSPRVCFATDDLAVLQKRKQEEKEERDRCEYDVYVDGILSDTLQLDIIESNLSKVAMDNVMKDVGALLSQFLASNKKKDSS